MAKLILPVAWETIRCASFIFLWRGQGFHANLWETIRADRQQKRDVFVRQIISNTKMILNLAVTQRVSVGNAMLWPLAVAGCECGQVSLRKQGPEILELLKSLEEIFSMNHVAYVRELLQELWQRQSSDVAGPSSVSSGSRILSLEMVARERRLTVPLL
jgi:hypothetical protein